MKKFEELDKEDQELALGLSLNHVLEAVCENRIRFNDKLNCDDLQARIDRAWEEMERQHTPWFIGERLMEDEYVAGCFKAMAQCDAEDALYADGDDPVVVRLPRDSGKREEGKACQS